jgi:[ribosomal protein S5]-alanine N-acetyltransferase
VNCEGGQALLRFPHASAKATVEIRGVCRQKDSIHEFMNQRSNEATMSGGKNTLLQTARLLLRPLKLDDAPILSSLAGRREIADTTISIPHPYSEEQAREWITRHLGPTDTTKEIVFAITFKAAESLIGTVGLREIDREHSQAEMGLWIAVEAWGKGYATEASAAALRFGFEELQLHRIYAHHMVRNPASGHVLRKIGMAQEGLLRQCVRKWGVFEDVILLAILREDWKRMSGD